MDNSIQMDLLSAASLGSKLIDSFATARNCTAEWEASGCRRLDAELKVACFHVCRER